MSVHINIAAGFIALLLIAAPANAGCSPPAFTSAERSVVPANAPDQKLFTTALIKVLAWHRCNSGRIGYSVSPRLIAAANLHSDNMARMRNFSHWSSAAGLKTYKDRARRAGVKWRFLAENIARMSRYQFYSDKAFLRG